MKERTLIFIDGSNFYFKLKSLDFENTLNFDFIKFAQFLLRKRKSVGARYYIGKVKQDGSSKADSMVANQQRLFAKLKKSKFEYVLGYLLKSGGKYHEKGVDVQMAVDMLVAAYENKCDRIILISSDTDLAPAIIKTQEKGKIVEYIGFSHQPSVAMVSFCRESRLLTKEEIEQFIMKK